MGLTSPHTQNCAEKSALCHSSLHSLRTLMVSYPCNKYEQPSYLLSVNCFEDKAIYIIKNIFQLTKYYLVP